MLGLGVIKPVVTGDDGIRANLDVVSCTGHGGMLYVVVDSHNFVSPMTVDGGRLKWREGSYPYTAFMRNCNLTDTPRSCRGLLCVFRKRGEEVYRLGVVGNLSSLWCKKLTIQEWTGSSFMDSGVYTPHFLYSAKAFPTDFQTVKSQFTPVEIDLDPVFPPEVIFVNTVSSHPLVPRLRNCINSVDGCFEMSPQGPDVIFTDDTMPPFGNSTAPLGRGEVQFDAFNPDTANNKHLPKRAPCCLVEPNRSIHHLQSLFHTVESEGGCPMMSRVKIGSLKGKMAVPYITSDHVLKDGDVTTFAFLSKANWLAMVAQKSMKIKEHNDYLQKKEAAKMELRVCKIDATKKGGVRVSVATREELQPFVERQQWIQDDTVKNMYSCQSFGKPNESGPGNVVIRFMIQRQVSLCLHFVKSLMRP